MKNIKLFLIAGAIILFGGCKKDGLTESAQISDQNPTKILLFEINNEKFRGTTGYAIVHIGDTVNWKIVASDKDKVSSCDISWPNSISSISFGSAHPLSDTETYSWSFKVDSTSNSIPKAYQPGTIVTHYLTIHDSLNYQTHLELQCIVSE